MKKIFYIFIALLLLVGGAFAVDSYLVPKASAQIANLQVSLVSQEPVYTWADARYSTKLWPSPFSKVEWIPGGYFVSSGACTPDVGGLRGGGFESGGMYVLDDEGNFIDKENVCWQTAAERSPCPEGGGCALGLRTHPISGGMFIRENTQDEASVPRSPLVYEINRSEVDFDPDSRLWFDEYPGGETGDILEVLDTAYVNGMLIAVEKRDEGVGIVGRDEQAHCSVLGTERGRWGYYNTVFSVPSMKRVASFSVPHPKRERPSSETCGRFGDQFSGTPPLTDAKFEPLFGVGEFFVALNSPVARAGRAGGGELVVYRMPDADELLNGAEPEIVQTLRETDPIGNIPRPRQVVRDSLDPNRIGLLFEDRTVDENRITSRTGVLEVYNVSEDGFEKVDEIRRSDMPTSGGEGSVAMSGDILAYTDGIGFSAGQMIVEKNGVRLSVEPLPTFNPFEDSVIWCDLATERSPACPPNQSSSEVEEREQGVSSIAIAPNGNILVATAPGGGDKLYLYTIGEGTGTLPPDIPDFPDFSDFNTEPITIDFYLDIARNFARDVNDIFGNNSNNNAANNSLCSVPLTTTSRIESFQCQTDIVCSGTPETTGYGNLGPQTRAKWQELCGTDPLMGGGGPSSDDQFNQDVRGASISLTDGFYANLNDTFGRILNLGKNLEF